MSYGKTQAGQLAFKERSPLLSARQRAAFILFDGVKSLPQVLEATAGLGVVAADVAHMIDQGFLADNAPTDTVTVVANAVETSRSPQARFSLAWPLATQLTATLGLRGLRLNIAVEAASGYDDLLALFPKIQAATGVEKARELERVLKG
jgi:phage-related tail fiber protein